MHASIDMDTGHRYLLVARVGRDSLHPRWLADEARRNFDVLLSCYDGAVQVDARRGVTLEQRPGGKAGGLARLLDEHAAAVACYRHVAVFDDDLDIATADISRMFRIADEHGFRICQPALSHDSYFSFAALLCNRGFLFRSTTFIEMMCPCFRHDMLPAASAIYALGYESGLDLLWCNLLGPAPGDYAVIDAVCARHTRPVGRRLQAHGFADGERYEDQIHAVMARFALPWLACVPYFGRRFDGSEVRGRLALLLASLRIAHAVPLRAGRRQRLRAVLTHWQHLLRRRPHNLRLPPLQHLVSAGAVRPGLS
jgi:hypothetical protein